MKYIIIIALIAAACVSGYMHLEKQKSEQQAKERQQIEQQQRQLKAMLEANFQKAFLQWYIPPKECVVDKSGPLRVSCINDKIRKKQEFKKTYKPS